MSRISGSFTGIGTNSPPMAAWKASRNPSPPSLTGTSTISAPGHTLRTPSATALFASTELMQPLNESTATTTLRIFIGLFMP